MSALTLQSCFQDMDHPAFDYPDSSAPKVFSPMKLFLPFENDMRDKGNYTFLMSAGGILLILMESTDKLIKVQKIRIC